MRLAATVATGAVCLVVAASGAEPVDAFRAGGREPDAPACDRLRADVTERMRHPGTPIETKAALAEAYARSCAGEAPRDRP